MKNIIATLFLFQVFIVGAQSLYYPAYQISQIRSIDSLGQADSLPYFKQIKPKYKNKPIAAIYRLG